MPYSTVQYPQVRRRDLIRRSVSNYSNFDRKMVKIKMGKNAWKAPVCVTVVAALAVGGGAAPFRANRKARGPDFYSAYDWTTSHGFCVKGPADQGTCGE